MRTPRSACRLMRGADGRRCCLAGAALLALLFVDLAVRITLVLFGAPPGLADGTHQIQLQAVGDARTQEAKDARVREKELQKQLTELKKENRAREKEAKAEGKKSTGHKPGNPKGAANAPRLGGLSLLTGATAAPPPSGTGESNSLPQAAAPPAPPRYTFLRIEPCPPMLAVPQTQALSPAGCSGFAPTSVGSLGLRPLRLSTRSSGPSG